jgi:hypothetical protein
MFFPRFVSLRASNLIRRGEPSCGCRAAERLQNLPELHTHRRQFDIGIRNKHASQDSCKLWLERHFPPIQANSSRAWLKRKLIGSDRLHVLASKQLGKGSRHQQTLSDDTGHRQRTPDALEPATP